MSSVCGHALTVLCSTILCCKGCSCSRLPYVSCPQGSARLSLVCFCFSAASPPLLFDFFTCNPAQDHHCWHVSRTGCVHVLTSLLAHHPRKRYKNSFLSSIVADSQIVAVVRRCRLCPCISASHEQNNLEERKCAENTLNILLLAFSSSWWCM